MGKPEGVFGTPKLDVIRGNREDLDIDNEPIPGYDRDFYVLNSNGAMVEAIQVLPDTATRIVHWTGGLQVEEQDHEVGRTLVGINVRGRNGLFRASEGDWIVKWEGEFVKLTDPQFRRLYTKS